MLSREELFNRARELLPAIRDRAPATEALRRIPDETIADLRNAGLLRIANPQRYGGYGLEPDVLFDIAMELASACSSTGWCFCVVLIHNWMIGQWPEQLQEEYFATDPDTLASSSFGPRGRLEAARGGFRLSGRWDFSSGCDAASWALLGAMSDEGPFWVMVPRADYAIVDTWFVSGLQGSGSKDIQVDDAFVPRHRVIKLPKLHERIGDGWGLHGRSSYRLPIFSMLSQAIPTPLVGMAQGAVNEFVASLSGKKGPGRTADSVALQLRLAESSAEVDTARILIRHNVAEMLERAQRGDYELSELDMIRYRRDGAFAVRLCVQATGRLFEASGGGGIYTSKAIQRFFRDINAASHHTSLYWDFIAEQYGRGLLGQAMAMTSASARPAGPDK